MVWRRWEVNEVWVLGVAGMILKGKHRRTCRKIGPTVSLSTTNPTWTPETQVSVLCVICWWLDFDGKPGYLCYSVSVEDCPHLQGSFLGIARLKRDGTRAETRFGLSAKRTSPFKSAGVSVQSTAGSRGVRISGQRLYRPCSDVQSMAAGYPLHSHLSLSLPLPCVTVCHQVLNALYLPDVFIAVIRILQYKQRSALGTFCDVRVNQYLIYCCNLEK